MTTLKNVLKNKYFWWIHLYNGIGSRERVIKLYVDIIVCEGGTLEYCERIFLNCLQDVFIGLLTGAPVPHWCICTSLVHMYLTGASVPHRCTYTGVNQDSGLVLFTTT